MRTAMRHATVVTADAARTVHHDATLVIEDDRIAAVDPTNQAGREPGPEVIDPEYGRWLRRAVAAGVEAWPYRARVGPASIRIARPLVMDL